MAYFKLGALQHGGGHTIVTDCPHCGKGGTFDRVGTNDLISSETFFGSRMCTNPACRGHVFYIRYKETTLLYPPVTIPFSSDGIPEKILSSFKEAIICHSNSCFISSAIMLRKTLEEICSDQKATGANLYKRLEALSKIIILPNELIEATHELRLLGNDAAHLESETYNQIGSEEIEISVEFIKEILKAVYQYKGLLGKLRGLKKAQ